MSFIACLDLEGVLVPEIWIEFSRKTGIKELQATTRDISDYSELMKMRLDVCAKNRLRINDIQEVISQMSPLPGAKEFLYGLKQRFQVVILSDTFYQFAEPLMKQLGYPTLFCHNLVIDDAGRINDFKLRMEDQKRAAVKAFKALNFKVLSAGDSYNDISMLLESDQGVLFCPPQNVIDEYPQLTVSRNYAELNSVFDEFKG
ncbi:MAG: bifunctional phosphoserine phosphatase/homoserine phosphotransferase ThrH [Verrucomicrobiaceae bacterium TMED76]|nr:MAG: bifunctional phosphoserine phosphatase/homoserine phosphotransferase ThrH [Verrucomicrobiaceae bacterium TMED76]